MSTQNQIKPIETHYQGYRFRSRLEARWAVFFDALGLKWDYEREGYDLGALGWYLPDFWLIDLGKWVEIKGTEPTDGEKAMAQALCEGRQEPVCLFPGTPDEGEDGLVCACGWQWIGVCQEEIDYMLQGPDEYGGIQRVACFVARGGAAFRRDPLTFEDALGVRLDWQRGIRAARAARFERGEYP